MDEVLGTQQVDAMVVPHTRGVLFHVRGGDEIAVRLLAAPEVSIACAALYAGQGFRVEHLSPVEQDVEHVSPIFLRTQREVGDFIACIHETIQVAMTVVIRCQPHGARPRSGRIAADGNLQRAHHNRFNALRKAVHRKRVPAERHAPAVGLPGFKRPCQRNASVRLRRKGDRGM